MDHFRPHYNYPFLAKVPSFGGWLTCRWHNHLNPDIRKSPWTAEEDRIIVQAHAKYGNQWSYIAKLLDGRSVWHFFA